MKFATAVVLALVGAVSAKAHGQCGSGKHRHHTGTKAKASTTLSEIVKPTSIVVKSTPAAVTSSAIATTESVASSTADASSALPTAIINIAPPPAGHHSHFSPSSQSRSTVLVTSTVTASSAAATSVVSSSSVAHTSSTATSTSVVAPTTHSTTSVVVPTSTKATTTSSSSIKTTTSSVKTSTTSSSQVPVPTSGSSSKRGLGFNNAADTMPFAGTVSWTYNWDSTYSGTLPAGAEYYPMLWSSADEHTSKWNAAATKAIENGSQYLLGFNEPDLSSQANMSPEAAAAAWKTYMEPFANQAQLVSPAVTNGGAPMGLAWMDSFLAACSGCHVDAIAIHIYDSATNEAYFKSYISSVVTRYNKPVFVTEFGGSGSTAAQQTFLGDMVSFLDGLNGLAKYSAFGDFQGTFVSGSQLTALGSSYAHA